MPARELVRTYTLECGCVCEDWEKDVWGTYNICATDQWTKTVVLCEKHATEKRKQEEEDEEILNAYNKRLVELRQQMETVKHIQTITLGLATQKYKKQTKLWWKTYDSVKEHLIDMYGDILRIEITSGILVCSKEKLDAIDFKLWEFRLPSYLLTT